MNLYEKRLGHLRTAMQENGLDALILTPGAPMRYLTGFSEAGFERLLALIVPPGDRPWLFLAPALNADQVRRNPAGVSEVRVWDDGAGWERLLGEVGKDLRLDTGTIGLDDDMPARFSLKIAELMPTARLKLAGPALSALRLCKDSAELDAMQRAADATDALIPALLAACRPGATELEVALTVRSGLAQAGHEASFDPIIGAGANGALPHHHTDRSRLHRGDVAILDFGAKVDGYCGDITRTVALGEASDEACRVYEIVYRAYRAGVDAVRPGASGHDVDAAARRVIADAGYGEFFVHRTGHGIGLDDHEPPYMVAGNHVPLQPGQCFSVEPGIYLPGKFGVRLENIVTVREDGTARVLNQEIPAELPVV
ncbi:MAG: aminopeptidase P family protein [Armatimonadetes bacterium]|nr:aminopeptidase P family protein [Armatimonadota bacterium]